jgi:hypothetical protein
MPCSGFVLLDQSVVGFCTSNDEMDALQRAATINKIG